ncbi:Ras-like protein [Psilocybe cubensis]|uniref:Ras-like protein n=2 Tax=Psilocybe cubensis TaxID=181762 RepID=A0ACB8GSE3_PSICU|nr:Ras-like protein [Psilocybe cubensis]KAH9478342.1 Ras-like protein [Psilocybe cubensis]
MACQDAKMENIANWRSRSRQDLLRSSMRDSFENFGSSHNNKLSIADYRDMEEEMPSCDGYIILYSIASRSSFQEVSRICRQIPLNGRQDPNLMLILAGTKSDLKSSRQVSTEEGLALAKELGCEAFFETSAKSGENVDAVVLSMVQALRRAAASRDMDMMAPFRMMRNLFRGEKS